MSLYVGSTERYMQPRAQLDPDNAQQSKAEIDAAHTARAKADGGLDGPRGNEVAYIIQPSDTLTSIAQTYDQNLDELIQNNAQILDPGKINPYRIVFLPKPDARTLEVHHALREDEYLQSPLAKHTESMADLSQAKTDNNALWAKIEKSIETELRQAGADQLFPEEATQQLLTDIRSRAPDFDHYQEVVGRAYSTMQKEWLGGSPNGTHPARYNYDPNFDPKTQPELAQRSELTSRLFGGPSREKVNLTPEEKYNIPTDQLAQYLASGNPIEQSVYARVYGGKDPLTGQSLKPLWETTGMTREQLRKTLTEEPWKIASRHLGREISKQDYEKLQAIDGPLGHLMNMGVDPKTALTLQATWSAHFYGGHDPITQSQLKPIWQQWGIKSPAELQSLFENDPAAAIALSELTGGQNPATGKTSAPPWEGTSDAYGAKNLKTAQNILGVDLLQVQKDAVPAGLWEPYALALTAPAPTDQLKYQNPAGLAQSPQIRNGTEIKLLGQTGVLTSTMDPLGAIGLFGLFAGGNPRAGHASSAAGQPQTGAHTTNDLPVGKNYQVHGFFQVFPGGDQESIWLVKAQSIPNWSKEARAQYQQRLEQTHKDYWVAKGVPNHIARDQAKKLAAQQTEEVGTSRFIKSQGAYTDAGGNVLLFMGKSDESSGSRARAPMIMGVDWGLASDGSLDRLGFTAGAPIPLNAMPKWNAAGFSFQMSKNSEGNWTPSSIPVPTVEWGTGRYQIYPSLYLDPDTHDPSGFNIWGGTGYRLAQLGYQQDNVNPRVEVNLTADPTHNNGLGPNVTYSNPQKQSFQIGYMGGKGGKSLGFVYESSKSVDTKVYVQIGAEGVDGARGDAEALHDLVTGDKPPTWTELPIGTGVSNSSFNADTARLMAFVKLFNFGGSYGDGVKTDTQVQRTGDNTWTVARYEENQNEYSALAGVIGIGYGGRFWDANMQGESFDVTGAGTGTNGKPILDATAQAAIDEYLKEGLFPNALGFEGRFQGQNAETYKQLRDEYQSAHQGMQNDPQGRGSQVVKQRYFGALEKLNQFCREQLKPGDEILPGIKLTQTTTRKTDGESHSFILPDAYRRESVTGKTKFEDHEIGTYELTRDWWFKPDVKQQYTGQTGAGPDAYILSTQSDVKHNPPADWDKPVGVPYDIVKDVSTNAYPPMLRAVNADKDVKVNGKLSVNLTAGQILDIGKSLNTGPDSGKLWNSFAARTSSAFEGKYVGNNLLAHAPEYFDNIGKKGIVDGVPLEVLKLKAEDAAKTAGVEVTDDLRAKFARTNSVEAFRQLSEPERKLFTDIVLLTSSADHSPYEALAPMAVTESNAPNAQPLLSEDARSQGFEQVIKQFEHMNFSPGNIELSDEWRNSNYVRGSENFDDRIYMEPTSELLRFVRDEAVSDNVKGTVFSQAGFDSALPEPITEKMAKPSGDLEKDFKTEVEWKPSYYNKGIAEIRPNRGRDAASALIAIGSKDGSDAAWAMLDKYHVDPDTLFTWLGDFKDENQILKQALIDVLSPEAPPEQVAVLSDQQKEVDKWLG